MNLKGLVTGIQGQVMATNDELAVIKSELALMKILMKSNMELLLTPQGKRDGFKP